MISFNQIPVSIRVPGTYVEIDNSRARRGLVGLPTRILVIGQRKAGGSAAAQTLQRVTSTAQAKGLFGVGSQLAHMLEALFKGNDYTDTWAIGINDNVAGVVATCTLTFTGPATSAGTLNLYIGGRRVQALVNAADTATVVATALAAAINADTSLAVTAAAVAGVITLTATHKGEVGNYIDVRHSYYSGEALPAGLGLVITAMAGGTGNPNVQPALDLIGDEWFTDIIVPWSDASNFAALDAKLVANFGPMKSIDTHGWVGASGSHATLTTLGSGKNSPHLTIVGIKASPTPPWEWAAAFAGIAAYHLDIDPARPLQTLRLPGVLPPAALDRFTWQERNLLLYDGIATVRFDAGGNVLIERAITTYQTNAFGAPDDSYLDVETMRTLAMLRYDLRSFIALKFPRHKLADDGTQFSRGQAVVTPKTIRGEIIARFKMWEEQGLAEDIDQFKADIIVERDPNDPNRVNALVPPNIINQLRVFAGQIQFRL